MLSTYARARVADGSGAAGEAVQGYAAALAASPDNEVLAARTLSQALAAGDRPLALKAAHVLERAGLSAPDVRLLLLTEAFRTEEWKSADRQIERIERDEVFAFMAPVFRAWAAFGSGKGDPMAALARGAADPLAGPYIAEQRPLLLLASGRRKEAIPVLLSLSGAAAARSERLRIASAALLARRGEREEALRLLQGDGTATAAARRLIEARKPVPGAVDSAQEGAAEFLVRLAIDLQRQEVLPLALSLARLATFLAPDNAEAWLVTSRLLAASNQEDAAIGVLANIAPGDPLAATALDARIRLLTAADRQQAAMEEARVAANGEGATAADWARLGDLYGQLKRYQESADAYARALELTKESSSGQAEWALQLLRGGALEQADKWPEAKAALEAAYKLAPDQPLVLNYLGYAQLERRENIQEAEGLVREASRLQPDSAEITDSLGWAHFLRGDHPKAIELLERAAAGQPSDPAINEHLGDAYFSVGRRYEARYAWEAALLYAEEEDAARLRAKIEAGLTPQLASP